MKCTLCKEEMKEGYIPITKDRLYWAPKNTDIPFFVYGIPKGAVDLGVIIFRRKKVQSFYCQNCHIVVTPVKNNKDDKHNVPLKSPGPY